MGETNHVMMVEGHQWLDEETSHGGHWQQSPATNTSILPSIIHLEQQPLNESSSSSISSQQHHYLHTQFLTSNKLLHVGKCTQNSNFGGNYTRFFKPFCQISNQQCQSPEGNNNTNTALISITFNWVIFHGQNW